jgi:hypothetical protein
MQRPLNRLPSVGSKRTHSCHSSSYSSSHSESRRGRAALTILLSLLVVALGTLAVGSTIVAMRAIAERDKAKQDFAKATRGLDATIEVVAANTKPVKKELLQPALDYYQQFAQSHADDKTMLAELASARFHTAALHAKLGSKEGVAAMTAGLNNFEQLTKDETADPATFPSLQDSALKVATPVEWFMVKGADQAYGMQLMMGINRATTAYEGLSKKYPTSVSFRDNYSALLKGSALLQGQLPNGRERSLASWLKARDVLETLIRDQPANTDFQTRLAESLLNAGRMQKSAKEIELAQANFKRAVEVREQMAAAEPDNKTFQQDLNAAKRELDRAKPTEAAKAAEPAKDDKPAENKEAAPTQVAADAAAADAPPPEPAPAEPAPADAAGAGDKPAAP